MLETDEVITTATGALPRFRYLAGRVSAVSIERSVKDSWPNPPAPLVFLLWVAGSDLAGKEPSNGVLASLDTMVGLLTKTSVVTGAWQSRVNRLVPPRRGGGFADHYSNFQSALFELILAFRMVLVDKTQIVFRGELDVAGCDLSVLELGASFMEIEAYAPRKGADLWYQRTVAAPWNALVTGSAPAPETKERSVRHVGIDPDAVAKALSRVLTTTNFDQKAAQLEASGVPALLAIRGYGLTKELHELAALSPPLDIARRMDPEAWLRLPAQCPGLLLCLLGDALKITGRRSPIVFIPAPGRTITEKWWEYLESADVLARDVLAARAEIVSGADHLS